MSYSVPFTAITGTVAPAADWNTGGRDNILFLATPPSVKVFHSAPQALANNTVVTLAFDSELWDTDTMHSTVTNNTRLTAKTAGKYLISGGIEISGTSAGTFREIAILFNGTGNKLADDVRVPVNVSNGNRLVITAAADLAVNQYVELEAAQDSGGSLNVNATGVSPALPSPWFSMVWQGF